MYKIYLLCQEEEVLRLMGKSHKHFDLSCRQLLQLFILSVLNNGALSVSTSFTII